MANRFKEGDYITLSDPAGFEKWAKHRWEHDRFIAAMNDATGIIQVKNIHNWSWMGGIAPESFDSVGDKIYSGWIPQQFFELATIEQAINTYGLNIGDVIDGNILNKWCKAGKNEYSIHLEKWEVQTVPWGGENHTISEFTVCPDGIPGFRIGAGCLTSIRAEGFYDYCMNMRAVPATPSNPEELPFNTHGSYCGLSINDIIPCEILNKIPVTEKCYWKDRWEHYNNFVGSTRSLLEFKQVEGIIVALISGTADLWIKASYLATILSDNIHKEFDPQGSYYGLKVGDPVYLKPLNEWIFSGKNERKRDEDWRNAYSTWDGDNSYISDFHKFPDGTIGFKLSRSEAFYIRAEGFVQFCEEYKRSKSVFPVEQHIEFHYPLTQQQAVGRHTRRDNFKTTIALAEEDPIVKIDFNDKSYLSDPLNREFKVTIAEEDDEKEFQRSRNHQKLLNLAKSYGMSTPERKSAVNTEEDDDLPF